MTYKLTTRPSGQVQSPLLKEHKKSVQAPEGDSEKRTKSNSNHPTTQPNQTTSDNTISSQQISSLGRDHDHLAGQATNNKPGIYALQKKSTDPSIHLAMPG